MNKKRWNTIDLTTMALLVALLSISAYIIIPLPFSTASLTAQSLIVNLVGLLLPPGWAAMTILVWIFLGVAGLPVFSGGTAGLAKLAGPTGGYILGFLVAVVVISLLKGKPYKFLRYSLTTVLVGVPIIDLIGTIAMKYILNIGWKAAFISGFLPFIPLDIAKGIAAAYVAKYILRAIALSKQGSEGQRSHE